MTNHGWLHRTFAAALAAALLAGCAPAALAQTTMEPTPAPLHAAATQPAATLHQRAIDQVLTSARSPDPVLRADAIEAAQNLPDRVVPLVQLGLNDPRPAVRFSALATIGKLKLKHLAPAARHLLDDPSASVRAAAIYALTACGEKVDASPMARMLAGDDLGVRANAVMLLGMIGERSAVPMIKDMSRIPTVRAAHGAEAVERVQVAEALAKLGDPDAITVLRAACYSQYDDVRVLAIQALGRTQDHKMETGLHAIMVAGQNSLEIKVAAAEALARLGNQEGLPVALQAAADPHPTIRAQVAVVLPLFDDQRAKAALALLLEDPEEPVRLTAAAGILSKK